MTSLGVPGSAGDRTGSDSDKLRSAGDMSWSSSNHSRAVWESQIRNKLSFRLEHRAVPEGSDGSDRTPYPLTENYTLAVAPATGQVVSLHPLYWACDTHHQNDRCVTVFAGAAILPWLVTQRLVMF